MDAGARAPASSRMKGRTTPAGAVRALFSKLSRTTDRLSFHDGGRALFSKLSRTTDKLSFHGPPPAGHDHSPGFPPKPRQPHTKPALPEARRPASPAAGALLPSDNRSLCHWVTLSLCRYVALSLGACRESMETVAREQLAVFRSSIAKTGFLVNR